MAIHITQYNLLSGNEDYTGLTYQTMSCSARGPVALGPPSVLSASAPFFLLLDRTTEQAKEYVYATVDGIVWILHYHHQQETRNNKWFKASCTSRLGESS